ncbi:hypothetical protein ACSBOB_20425 [Mesorhizobium sp. ASY16-5R]|uniref:hypothetical protein n=1 Tax=Mesorhizobium sp. ASY16-5R TaxID=3445772 RepID=UPI003FA18370
MVEWLGFAEACEIVQVKLGLNGARAKALLWGAVLRRDFSIGHSPTEVHDEERRLFPSTSRTPQGPSDADRQSLTIIHHQSFLDWLQGFPPGKATGDEIPPVVPHRPKGTSYAAADAPLVQEMHNLISRGEYPSARSAAMSLIAKIKGAGTPDSLARRLVDRYKETYGANGE